MAGNSAESAWPGAARCAVSLSYDGALPDHVELVRPLLNRVDLRGTFYVTPEGLLESPQEWVKMAGEGHEIGSHNFFGVTQPDGSLPNWDLKMVRADLELTQRLLRELMPDTDHASFAYPGNCPQCADGDYQEAVTEYFRTARSWLVGHNDPRKIDPYLLRYFPTEGLTGDAFIREVELAARNGSWIIFAFQGIGSGDPSCDLQAHTELCLWLEKAKDLAWVAPVGEVASFVTPPRLSVAMPL